MSNCWLSSVQFLKPFGCECRKRLSVKLFAGMARMKNGEARVYRLRFHKFLFLFLFLFMVPVAVLVPERSKNA
jgi:hypothetical protein